MQRVSFSIFCLGVWPNVGAVIFSAKEQNKPIDQLPRPAKQRFAQSGPPIPSKPPKKAGGLSGIENVSQAGRQPLAQPLQSQYPRLGPHQILCGPSSAKLTGSRRARIWRLQGLVAFTYHCVSGAVRETRLAKHKQVTEMPGPVIISAKSVDYLLNQRSGEPARFSTVIKMHDCTRQTLFLYHAACDS